MHWDQYFRFYLQCWCTFLHLILRPFDFRVTFDVNFPPRWIEQGRDTLCQPSKERFAQMWSGLKIDSAMKRSQYFYTFCFNDFNPPAYFSPVLHVEDTSQMLWIFCTIQKKLFISQKVLCYKFKVSKSEKSNTVFTTLQHLIYYTMCMFCMFHVCKERSFVLRYVH